jgi:hypothetical protein
MSSAAVAARRARRPLVLEVVIVVTALAYLAGGLRLMTLGGTSYYFVGGAVLLAVAVLLWRSSESAPRLYAMFMVATVAWALAESGLTAHGECDSRPLGGPPQQAFGSVQLLDRCAGLPNGRIEMVFPDRAPRHVGLRRSRSAHPDRCDGERTGGSGAGAAHQARGRVSSRSPGWKTPRDRRGAARAPRCAARRLAYRNATILDGLAVICRTAPRGAKVRSRSRHRRSWRCRW